MKTLVSIIIIIVALSATSVNAQHADEIKAKSTHVIVKQFQQTFKSQSDEVIASSLAAIIQYAQKYGTQQMDSLKESIAVLSYTKANPDLRYKAYLTLETLSNDAVLSQLPNYNIENTDEMFFFIQNSMQSFALNRKN